MIEWKEVYGSEGYYAYVGRFRLDVTRHIDLGPTDWKLSIDPVINSVLGGDVSADDAKMACEDLFRTMLRQALAELAPPMKRKKAKP